MNGVMQVRKHVVSSIVISALLWWFSRSIAAAVACFLAGVLVDLDHLFDFIFNHRGRLRFRRLFLIFEYQILENIFIFLHSWEFALCWLGLLLAVPVSREPVVLGLFIGFVTHLGLDNLFNRHSRWAYFLLYRLRHGFQGKYYYGAREYRHRLKNARRSSAPS